MMDNLCAVILAAGKGTRMKSTDTNKVAIPVNGEPMLQRSIRILRESGIKNIVVVVGFASDSVTALLEKDIILAYQNEQLGTGHAVDCAIPKIPTNAQDVLIIYGDDSFLHTPKTYEELYKTHVENNSHVTFITMDSDSPTSFGRIIRNDNGEIVGIVEEKNANDDQKKIKEINLGCYVIGFNFLKDNIKNIKRNKISKEYYITDIIDIVSKQGGKISAYKLKDQRWKGINTPQDLDEAEAMLNE